jgi:hypothetical protein
MLARAATSDAVTPSAAARRLPRGDAPAGGVARGRGREAGRANLEVQGITDSRVAGSSGSGNFFDASSSAGHGSSGGGGLPRVNVIGSGRLAALGLAAELEGSVYVYKDLPYDQYYDTICRWALL